MAMKPRDEAWMRLRVNLILFEAHEVNVPLPREDRRAAHILGVLSRRVNDTFDAGLVNGPRGKATLTAIGTDALSLSFAWGDPPPPAAPISLLIGLPRPQTARDILREATALGVAGLKFFASEKGEPSYARSTLWSSGEWQRLLLAGAEQAFDTRVPLVTHHKTLAAALAEVPTADASVALDNYEATVALGQVELKPGGSVVLAVGSERGWSPGERDLLRGHRFTVAHLGPRVLRVETAVIAALAIVRAKLALM